MIEVKSVSMNYGRTVALSNASFIAEKGKILGLLGPNGAGKTTVMRILTSFLFPSEGTAIVNGKDVTEDPLAVRSLIGYMPESVPLYDDMIVDEYLIFIGQARGLSAESLDKRLSWVKEACGIRSVWKHNISEISKGFRQRVGLAQALIHDPKVLILDEPTAGLDPLQIINIRKLIRKLAKDKTVIFSTHIFQEVEALADRIVILDKGRVIADGTRQEITKMATKGEKLTLVVGVSEKEVKSVLESEGIKGEVRFEGLEGEDFVKFSITSDKGKTLILKLNRIIEKKKWNLRELKREHASLEEAFIWLLTKDSKKKPDTED